MRVRYTKQVLLDLAQAREHTRTVFGAGQERVFVADLREIVDQLGRFPLSGVAGRVRGTRELFLQKFPFVLIYRVQGEQVDLVACLHQSRQWP